MGDNSWETIIIYTDPIIRNGVFLIDQMKTEVSAASGHLGAVFSLDLMARNYDKRILVIIGK